MEKALYNVIIVLLFLTCSLSTHGQEISSTSKMSGDKITFTVNGVSFNMVYVEGGDFIMGATSEQGDVARKNEHPVHNVNLSGFYIGETEITESLWIAVMGSYPFENKWKGGNIAMHSISYNDVKEFIVKLNTKTGKIFRMPTEAEWEYAARGGNLSRNYRYSGSNDIDSVAWYKSCNTVFSVAQKKPNELGIYDMSGNVGEWVEDSYEKYTDEPQTNPKHIKEKGNHVFRGGGWYCDKPLVCRTSFRERTGCTVRVVNIGFRLAMSDGSVSNSTIGLDF